MIKFKQISKLIGVILLAATLIIGGFLLYITLTDYTPEEVIELEVVNNQERVLQQGEPITVTTFNIGYAGLDRNQDFFMDGGTKSRSSSEQQTITNMEAIASFMKEADSDMYILQEVDKKSSRSYKLNQVDYISSTMANHSYTFAVNYKVPWVPVPLLDPMGTTYSGLLTLSKFASTANHRIDLPGKESWPLQQFDLDRAMIESRLPVDNGRELVLINLHLSAFDEGGIIRKQQLDYLLAYIKKESEQGNYLIIGGDWNHVLPGTDPEVFKTTQAWPEWLQKFPDNFKPEDFNWAVDAEVSTVRTLDVPYTEGENFRAVIDGFLVSSNIEIIAVQGKDLGHANSDHNPVTVQFVLR